MQVNFDAADPASFLKLSEIQFRSEKTFCLSKNCAYYIWFFNDAFYFKSCVNNILYCKGLGCSRKRKPPIFVSVELV